MRIFGRQFVMLNSAKAALDLFERRSAIYSSRPQLVRQSLLFRSFTSGFADVVTH